MAVEYNDLFYQNEQLRSRNLRLKAAQVEQLRSEMLPASHQLPPRLNRGGDRPNLMYSSTVGRKYTKFKPESIEAVIKNFESCSDFIISNQQVELMKMILRRIDAQIEEKLRRTEANEYEVQRFIRSLEEKRETEKTTDSDCQQLERQLIDLKKQIEDRRDKIKNFQDELLVRAAKREQSLKENKAQHITANLNELDYLYKNDPESLLEDSDKYIRQIKDDIERFKDEYDSLASQPKQVNYRVYDKYDRLKKQLAQAQH